MEEQTLDYLSSQELSGCLTPRRITGIETQSAISANVLERLIPNEENLDEFFNALRSITPNGVSQAPDSPLKRSISFGDDAQRMQINMEEAGEPACYLGGYKIIYIGGCDNPVYRIHNAREGVESGEGIFRILPVGHASGTQEALNELHYNPEDAVCLPRTYARVLNDLATIEFIERVDTHLQSKLEEWHPLLDDSNQRTENILNNEQKEQLIDWFDQTYRYLNQIHEKYDIVFTDVKPANIYLIDNQVIFSDIKSLSVLPLAEQPPMTPEYCPPDFDMSRYNDYDPYHLSLYALALTAAELLTGSRRLEDLQKSRNIEDALGQELKFYIEDWSSRLSLRKTLLSEKSKACDLPMREVSLIAQPNNKGFTGEQVYPDTSSSSRSSDQSDSSLLAEEKTPFNRCFTLIRNGIERCYRFARKKNTLVRVLLQTLSLLTLTLSVTSVSLGVLSYQKLLPAGLQVFLGGMNSSTLFGVGISALLVGGLLCYWAFSAAKIASKSTLPVVPIVSMGKFARLSDDLFHTDQRSLWRDNAQKPALSRIHSLSTLASDASGSLGSGTLT